VERVITRIRHIALAVNDLERVVRIFTDALDAGPFSRDGHIALCEFGNGAQLRLFDCANSERRGPGVDHILVEYGGPVKENVPEADCGALLGFGVEVDHAVPGNGGLIDRRPSTLNMRGFAMGVRDFKPAVSLLEGSYGIGPWKVTGPDPSHGAMYATCRALNLEIEIIQPEDPDDTSDMMGAWLKGNGGNGVFHLTFDTGGALRTVLNRLKSAGGTAPFETEKAALVRFPELFNCGLKLTA
jgi:hypothetical protein